MLGLAIAPNSYNPKWANYSQHIDFLGVTILLSTINNAQTAASTSAHEFGHHVGLAHPDDALGFEILKTDGFDSTKTASDASWIKWREAARIKFPDFAKMSIMVNYGGDDLGELDHMAMRLLLGIYAEKFPSPNAANWQEKLLLPSNNSIDITLRR